MNLLKSISSKIRRCAVAILIAANLAVLRASATPIPVRSVHTNADGVTLTMSPGKMKLTVCSDGIVRVMYSPTATLPAGQDFVVTNRFLAGRFISGRGFQRGSHGHHAQAENCRG